jgi:YbbR domain-containing protein
MGPLMRNLGYKILSVAIAILLYAVASGQRNPRVTRDIFVQAKVENLPSDLTIKTDPPPFNVAASGTSSAIEAFRNQPVKATLDLSRGQPGVNRVTIAYKNDPQSVDIVGPPFAEVVLEQRREAMFVVDVDFDRTKAHPGYQFKDAVVKPKQVKVSGLASEMHQIDRVVAFVSNNNNGSFRGMVDVVAQNVRREDIDTVDIEPKTVMVTIEEQKAPATKTLILSAVVSGVPAPGYNVVNYGFDPSTVEVTGTPMRLKTLGSISVPVNISGLRASMTRNIPLTLPPGVSFAKPNQSHRVSIQLDVRPIAVPATHPTPTPQLPAAAPAPSEGTTGGSSQKEQD